MTIRSDNTNIVAQDYKTYEKIRVGMVRGSMLNESFAQFADDRNFTYYPVYYDTRAEMLAALQNGSIDAAVSISLRRMENERIIEKIATDDFYIAVKKGNQSLLDKLDYAIMQMNRSEGDWKTRLRDRYSERLDSKNLNFSDDEEKIIEEYRSGKKVLTIACDADVKPYAYEENGELKGIIPDYFKKLAEYVGIPYKIVIPKDKEESWLWRREGMVDAFIDGSDLTEHRLEMRDCAATAPYMHMKLAMLMRRDFSERPRTLAIAEDRGLLGVEDEYARGAEYIKLPTSTACMQAVLDGRADATFVYLYAAQEFTNNDERGLLTYTVLDSEGTDYRIVFTQRVNHRLAGIFSKAIYAQPASTIEDLASRYTSYKAQKISLFAFLRSHPGLSTFILILIFLLLMALLLLTVKLRSMLEEERRKKQEILELADKAQEANKSKSAFLFNMSHDIRTPMNAIIGFTRLAQNVPENVALVKDYLAKINISSKHLLALINEVLEMSRIESGKVTLNKEVCSLQALVDDLHTMMQEQVQAKKLHFDVVVDKLANDDVYADRVRLEQIMVNVVSNAVKYTPDGGEIFFWLRQLESDKAGYGKYELRVKDNGIGMSEEFLQKIFTPFERENTSTVSGIQGTGLGLSITKKFVELMDGTIDVESEKDKGSEFIIRVYLELTQKKYVEKAVATENAEKKQDFTGKRLLLTEDNLLNREIAKAILQQAGFTVDEAEDGAVAVEKLSGQKAGYYDAVLMDIQMPVMDGLAATRAIRKLPDRELAAIPIIAVSANAFAEDKKASLDAGMNAHVGKPINVAELLQVLGEVLQK